MRALFVSSGQKPSADLRNQIRRIAQIEKTEPEVVLAPLGTELYETLKACRSAELSFTHVVLGGGVNYRALRKWFRNTSVTILLYSERRGLRPLLPASEPVTAKLGAPADRQPRKRESDPWHRGLRVRQHARHQVARVGWR